MKTAEGMVDFSAPQVRDTAEPFVSAIRENLAGRTEALEDLAVELFARGLSTRDIEDAFTDDAGRRLVSRAAISEITKRLWEEYEAFTRRDLSEFEIVYLVVDGIAERLRPGQPREPVLAAWGNRADRTKGSAAPDGRLEGGRRDRPVVLPGHARPRPRRLVVSDGAPGLIRAIEECFPRSARQRCLAHRMRSPIAAISPAATVRLIPVIVISRRIAGSSIALLTISRSKTARSSPSRSSSWTCRSIAARSSSGKGWRLSQLRPHRLNRSACGQRGIRWA
jgi:transposase-like protein